MEGVKMDKGIQLLEEIIKTSTFRHKVLASNIANVDTPGYKAKDVPFSQEVNNQVIGMIKTSPDHIQGTRNPKEVKGITPVERTSGEDGNNVVLDMELAKMTENGLLYEAGVRLLSKKFQMFKTAITGK
jgi:flagellar basal-body rod protein FlgB